MRLNWIGLLAVCSLLPCVLTKDTDPKLRNKVMYCGACLGLAMEIEWYVGTTPDKKVEVGGFRIDADGNIKTKTVPLKHSDINLGEIFDLICRRMMTYAESIDKSSGNVNYIPTEARDGNKISMKYARVSSDIGHSLEFACDTILEEYEDLIIEMLKNGTSDVGELLCVEKSNLCNSKNVTDQFWTFGSAVMAGVDEAQANHTMEAQRKEKEKQDRLAFKRKQKLEKERQQKIEAAKEEEARKAEEKVKAMEALSGDTETGSIVKGRDDAEKGISESADSSETNKDEL